MYALPTRAPKPHLSHTSCGKDRAGGAVGGEIGRKKGRNSKKSGTEVFNITAAFI